MNLGRDPNISQDKGTVSSDQSVLVIDDNADILFLQKTLLQSAGYQVFAAESGTKALKVISEVEELNLILLDMRLGDMNGIEFLEILEEERPEVLEHVPVVFMTAMSEVPKSKAIGFIRKPTDIDIFLKAVSDFVEMGRRAPYRHH
jgi:CheY-like chemotaxis protein